MVLPFGDWCPPDVISSPYPDVLSFLLCCCLIVSATAAAAGHVGAAPVILTILLLLQLAASRILAETFQQHNEKVEGAGGHLKVTASRKVKQQEEEYMVAR